MVLHDANGELRTIAGVPLAVWGALALQIMAAVIWAVRLDGQVDDIAERQRQVIATNAVHEARIRQIELEHAHLQTSTAETRVRLDETIAAVRAFAHPLIAPNKYQLQSSPPPDGK